MLLEAVREADRPPGADDEAEYVPELLNKRLGTTDTVYAQIRRYSEAMKHGHTVGAPEVAGLARLVARRPDADAVFGAAGAATARAAFGTLSFPRRALLRILPRAAARPLARRSATRLAARYFGTLLPREGTQLRIDDGPTPALPLDGNGAGYSGRAFYEAGLRELLSLLALN